MEKKGCEAGLFKMQPADVIQRVMIKRAALHSESGCMGFIAFKEDDDS